MTTDNACSSGRALVFASIDRTFDVVNYAGPHVVVAWLADPAPEGPVAAAVLPSARSAVSRVEVIDQDGVVTAYQPPPSMLAVSGPGSSPAFRGYVESVTGRSLEDFAPWLLWHVYPAGAQVGVDVLQISRLRDSGLVFARTSSSRFDTAPGSAGLLRASRQPSAGLAQSISMESLNFVHFEPGTEIEVKLGLPEDVSIWSLSSMFYELVQKSAIEGFLPDIGNEMQRWRFAIHLHEVLSPASEVGYFSFSPNPSGSFVVHRKRFSADALRREEWSEYNTQIPDGDVERYLAERYPDLRTRPLPPAERTRFDVNLESARYGHFYGIEIDEVFVPSHNRRLHQLEIEYHRTRVHDGHSAEAIVDELERLTAEVQRVLTGIGLPHERYYYSKLSFLRDLVDGKLGEPAAADTAGRSAPGAGQSVPGAAPQ